ncbi:MAG: hypothetical protein XXXJIFNMEKO3_00770 [Candidatus Erwinia impunctatus]|nr:hypothetical protein XXXJIFNMEKO_00770 [Culicoides impunctatus]
MKKKLCIGSLVLVYSLTVSQQALASSDESSCTWGETGCVLESYPILNTSNDTRDNLLRLISEHNHVALPIQPKPDDLTKSRHFFFGSHINDGNSEIPNTESGVSVPVFFPVIEPLKSLGLESLTANYSGNESNFRENRFVSMTPESDANFLTALLTDKSLTQEQRQSLAKAKINLTTNSDREKTIDALSFPDGSDAQQFKEYLLAARHFYAGNYEQAQQVWLSLKETSQPWLAETSSYMLMRNALNKSSQNAKDEYDYFDVEKIDRPSAQDALKWAESYLQQWPSGQYTDSASGLRRRINWYLKNWNELAKLYDQQLTKTKNPEMLIDLVSEADSKLLSKDMTWNSDYFLNAPDSPLLTFIQTLRLMRVTQCHEREPCVDEEYLVQLKPIFESSDTLFYWDYLQLMLKYTQKDYPAILLLITALKTLPVNNILAFSDQVFYGKALMALNKWDAAREHWSALLRSTQDAEQQQFLQSELAATLVLSDKAAEVFASNSQVTSLRYRSVILKAHSSPELLRLQVRNAPNDQERTIALHSLLMRDLITAHYADWLQDKKLSAHITHPAIGEDFADVDLSVFDWTGQDTEKGYFCQSLEKTVTVLSENSNDGHALNCLAEFIRTTNAKINLWQDGNGNGDLSETLPKEYSAALIQPSRQAYYQQVITNPESEPEDKSYALYRSVMCYAPSGYNYCGGEEVDKLKRKGWFTQLKKQYSGSPWAQKLRYYW